MKEIGHKVVSTFVHSSDCVYIKLKNRSDEPMTSQDRRVETLGRRGGKVIGGAGVGLQGAGNVGFFLDLGCDYRTVFIL